MLGTSEGHALRKVYLFVRKLPLISPAWRALAGNEKWRDVSHYAASGGQFATASALSNELPCAEFGSEEYFATLVRRATQTCTDFEPIKKRILLINNGLSAGGAERQIVYTLKGLAERGYDARFIGELLGRAPGLDFHEATLADARIPVETLQSDAGPGKTLYCNVSRSVAEALSIAPADFMLDVLNMVAAIRRCRPEVVHLWQDETSTKHGFAALIAGVPRIVLSGRNLNPTHFQFHRPHMRNAYRALLKVPGLTLSNNTYAGAVSYAGWLGIPPDTIDVIHNGFDHSAYTPAAADARTTVRAQYGIGTNAKLIAGVFRLSPEKRPELWIDAAELAVKRMPGLAFVIAGTGPMESGLRSRLKSAGLDQTIQLVGETANIANLYAAADVMFLASSEEGAPNVLIEAQWHGLTCIATNAGGVAETVSKGATAEIVYDATPTNLADSLIKVLGDSKLMETARQAGPALVAERFGIGRMIDDTLSMYFADARASEQETCL